MRNYLHSAAPNDRTTNTPQWFGPVIRTSTHNISIQFTYVVLRQALQDISAVTEMPLGHTFIKPTRLFAITQVKCRCGAPIAQEYRMKSTNIQDAIDTRAVITDRFENRLPQRFWWRVAHNLHYTWQQYVVRKRSCDVHKCQWRHAPVIFAMSLNVSL